MRDEAIGPLLGKRTDASHGSLVNRANAFRPSLHLRCQDTLVLDDLSELSSARGTPIKHMHVNSGPSSISWRWFVASVHRILGSCLLFCLEDEMSYRHPWLFKQLGDVVLF